MGRMESRLKVSGKGNPDLSVIYERMRAQSGSATLHFKDGMLMQVHYTTVEKVERGKQP